MVESRKRSISSKKLSTLKRLALRRQLKRQLVKVLLVVQTPAKARITKRKSQRLSTKTCKKFNK